MNPSAAPEFHSWSAPAVPLTIEYLPEVLQEIRAVAVEGLRQLSRGGIEHGGLLFGTRGANSIRITSWRPIACEHAHGPAFLLSQKDLTALEPLLESQNHEPDLDGLHVLGWFVAHTRSGVVMTEADLRFFEQYFPWSWQTTLILRPFKAGSAEAGFFVRDANGNLKSDASYRTFKLEPPARTEVVKRRASGLESATEPAHSSDTVATIDPPLTRRRAWIWAVPLLLAIGVLVWMWQRQTVPPKTPGFSFRAIDQGGDMRVEWDPNSEPIRTATRGVLEIKDRDSPLLIALDTQRLNKGFFIYPPKSGDLQLHMTVYPRTGPPLDEFAKFVGPPAVAQSGSETLPPAPVIVDDAAEVKRERDQLRSQVDQLSKSLQKANARNRELEDLVRILENRVQVQKLLTPPPVEKK